MREIFHRKSFGIFLSVILLIEIFIAFGSIQGCGKKGEKSTVSVEKQTEKPRPQKQIAELGGAKTEAEKTKAETEKTKANDEVVVDLETGGDTADPLSPHIKFDPTFGQETVTLDPGHGTKHSRVGHKDEKVYTMTVAKILRKKLQKAGIKVVLTHEKIDYSEDLGKDFDEDNINRAKIANENNSALYFRIHTDAPNGFAAVYYPEKHPNRNLAQKSKQAAEIVWSEFLKVIKPIGINYRKEVLTDGDTLVGSRQGGLLTGSKASKVPTILVEMLPLNQKGVNWIKNPSNQDKMAQAMANGIIKYLKVRLESSRECRI